MTTKYVNWGDQQVKLTWKHDIIPPPRELTTSAHALCFSKGEVLLIHVNHRGWDFPGGHRKEGETPEACVKREALEEGYVTGRFLFLGYIIVDHRENPNWDENCPYPEVGYQAFYRMDIDSFHTFEAKHESSDRVLIKPEQLKNCHHAWNELYEQILYCALRAEG